jgi:hypothetical protein
MGGRSGAGGSQGSDEGEVKAPPPAEIRNARGSQAREAGWTACLLVVGYLLMWEGREKWCLGTGTPEGCSVLQPNGERSVGGRGDKEFLVRAVGWQCWCAT